MVSGQGQIKTQPISCHGETVDKDKLIFEHYTAIKLISVGSDHPLDRTIELRIGLRINLTVKTIFFGMRINKAKASRNIKHFRVPLQRKTKT